jgi:DNA-binding NarL/FixJ family response regulator
MTDRPIRIVLADDHPIFRRGLRQILDLEPDLRVLAECEDGTTAAAAIESLRPDVAVLDVDMPGMDGFAVVRSLRERGDRTAIVFLTMHGREDLVQEALGLGVDGYVVKEGAAVDVVQAIRAVKDGRPFISSRLSASLLKTRSTAAPASAVDLRKLTPAERRVLRRIAEFKSSKEIADELGISHRTVENHRTNIARKLELVGTHALSRFAALHRDQLR